VEVIKLAEEQLMIPNYGVIKTMKSIAKIRERIEELKADGSLPDVLQTKDYSSDQNLISFVMSPYGRYELGTIVDKLPSAKKLEDALPYYRRIKLDAGKTFADAQTVEKVEQTYLKQKTNERDNLIASSIYLANSLKEKEQVEKYNDKIIRKANRKRRRAKFFDIVRKIFGFAFKVAIVIGIFALPQVTGFGALFLGSTNAFIGTVGCAIASYYAMRALSKHVNELIDLKLKSSMEIADKMEKKGKTPEAQKNAEECASIRIKLKELEAKRKSLKAQLAEYDPEFVDKANQEVIAQKLRELKDAEKKAGEKGGDQGGKPARETSGEASRETSGEASRETSGEASRKTSGEASRKTSGEASRKTSGEASRETSGEASRETSGEASRKTSGEASREAGGEASKETREDASREAGGEASR